jgi:hypothetical protein
MPLMTAYILHYCKRVMRIRIKYAFVVIAIISTLSIIGISPIPKISASHDCTIEPYAYGPEAIPIHQIQ